MCGQPMTFLGEDADGKLGDRWYCYKDDQVFLAKAQQTGQVRTLVEPTAKPQPSVSGRLVANMVRPTRFCRECGAKIPRDSKFCEECGTELHG